MFYNIENAFQLVFECWKCIWTLIQPCSNDSPSIKHWRHHLVQINIFNVLATVHFKYRSSLLPVFLYLVIFIYSSMSAVFPFLPTPESKQDELTFFSSNQSPNGKHFSIQRDLFEFQSLLSCMCFFLLEFPLAEWKRSLAIKCRSNRRIEW